MNALELRAIIAVVLALLSGWGGYTLASHHYERLEAQAQVSRDQVAQAQQQKTIADLKSQQAATAAAEQKYVDLQAATNGLSDQLARSVQNYSDLRRGLVSATSTAAAAADAAREGADRDRELAGLVQQATAACLSDSTALTALQTWASANAKVTQ